MSHAKKKAKRELEKANASLDRAEKIWEDNPNHYTFEHWKACVINQVEKEKEYERHDYR